MAHSESQDPLPHTPHPTPISPTLPPPCTFGRRVNAGATEGTGWTVFSQINLQHCIAASATHSRDLAVGHTHISLIQEPWVYKGQVKGIDQSVGSLLYDPSEPGPRACIFVKRGCNALKLNGLCSRDLAVALVRLKLGGVPADLVVCSAYLPYDSAEPPPTGELRAVVDYCSREGLDLLIGCDANSHHLIWGSSNTNERGASLLEYLATTNLEILNRGSRPTFVTSRRQEVIDLTVGTPGVTQWIKNWRVDDEETLSDHRRISFQAMAGEELPPETTYRNPRATDWTSYREVLSGRLRGTDGRSRTEGGIEGDVESLQASIIHAYEAACPAKTRKVNKKVAWWNRELGKLRSASRRLLNKALRANSEENWAAYRSTQRTYKRLVRKSKTDAWRKFCKEVEALSTAARLRRIFTTGPHIKPGGLVLPGGSTVEKHEDVLAHLIEVHFPGSRLTRQGAPEGEMPTRFRPADWETATKVVTTSRVKWAIDSFDRFKSPGADGIFPALLQEGGEDLVRHLACTFRACLALRYVPKAWREVTIVFIPKPGKTSYDQAKSFRPISLTSFLLKTLERLVDRHIRDGALACMPVQQSQHAYQTGKSVETALHDLVGEIEGALTRKEATLCVFLDVEGAFDNTSFDAICDAARGFQVHDTIINWIHCMLKTRTVTASLNGTDVRARVGRGCPQGGVTSPLLWLMVVDGLLAGIERLGVKVIGFADDVCIAVSGNHPNYMTSKMQKALDFVETWCTSQSLRVNPNKTEMVLFTRKRRFELRPISIFGSELARSQEVRYLGVTLDSKLSWKSHISKQAQKALATFWACRRMFGQTWGLKPRMVRWIYKAIVVPQLIYASVVWWPALRRATNRKALDRVYRLTGLGITGALSTTPTLALGALVNLPPPHITAEIEARKAAIRLLFNGRWRKAWSGHASALKEDTILKRVSLLGGDSCPRQYRFHHDYQVLIPDRRAWIGDQRTLLSPGGPVWYTDGSKTKTGAGAGVWSDGPRTELSFALGPSTSVLQAELFAIKACAHSILEKRYRNLHIYVCSDSQAALRALHIVAVNSGLARDCVELLSLIARDNRVKLLWVPGHSGIQGNEKANLLAECGAARQESVDTLHLGASPELVRREADRWMEEWFADHWTRGPGMRHTRALLAGPAEKLGITLTTLDRGQLRVITGLVTGHWFTGRHAVRMGLTEEPICPRCNEAEETPLHLITSCKGLEGVRFEAFGSHVLADFKLEAKGVGRLLRFAKGAGLLHDTP